MSGYLCIPNWVLWTLSLTVAWFIIIVLAFARSIKVAHEPREKPEVSR